MEPNKVPKFPKVGAFINDCINDNLVATIASQHTAKARVTMSKGR